MRHELFTALGVSLWRALVYFLSRRRTLRQLARGIAYDARRLADE